SFSVFFFEPKKIRKLFFKEENEIVNTTNDSSKKLVYYFALPFLILQLLLPLRHYLIKGDVLWSEEGHRLSWRVMLRERTGDIKIKIVDNETQKEFQYDYLKNLTYIQAKQLAVKPDFIWQYCQRIKKEYEGKNISIYIDCKNSINDKPKQVLIDPNYDMAKAEWNYFAHNEWILLY
ncbi:MAG: HTTM domain-containing protein, partial [Flavobacterium haoranii]